MLIIRIHIPPGYMPEIKETIRQAVKDAALAALAIEVTDHLYVSVHEAHGRMGDGLPTVIIDTEPLADAERKQALASQVSRAVASNAGATFEQIYLLIRETVAENHFVGIAPDRDQSESFF